MKIKQFLRNNLTNQPYGVLYADLIDGKIRVGWSVVHPNDHFDKKHGEMIAFNRMTSHNGTSPLVIPTALVSTMEFFLIRAEKYFQQPVEASVVDGFYISTHRPVRG